MGVPSAPAIECRFDPAKTALIVIDLQNDYCSPLGAYGRAGADLSMMPPIIERAGRLIDGARAAGVLVIWLQQTTLRGGLSAAPSSLRGRDRYLAVERCVDGTFGHAYVESLLPLEGEPVVRKLRSSGFVGTMLDQILDANGIRTCAMIGVGTEGCVEATARSALDHNYRPVIVEDCVASTRMDLHAHALRALRALAGVVTSEEVLSQWRAGPFAGDVRPRRAVRAHDTLGDLVRPAHSALLVVRERPQILATAALVRRAARRVGAPVVHLCGSEEAGPSAWRSDDLLLPMPGLDGFEGTALHWWLDRRDIHTVILTGGAAHRAVASTARGAVHRNYHVVCVEDAIDDGDPGLREAALAVMRQRYDTTSASTIDSLWTNHHPTPTRRTRRTSTAHQRRARR
jgi:ureidoacrylate peracid hydrolase